MTQHFLYPESLLKSLFGYAYFTIALAFDIEHLLIFKTQPHCVYVIFQVSSMSCPTEGIESSPPKTPDGILENDAVCIL